MKMPLLETSDTKYGIVPEDKYVYVSSSMKHSIVPHSEDISITHL